jgi:hypothetical protein
MICAGCSIATLLPPCIIGIGRVASRHPLKKSNFTLQAPHVGVTHIFLAANGRDKTIEPTRPKRRNQALQASQSFLVGRLQHVFEAF